MTRHARRRGFTILESALALAMLTMASVLVAELTTWALAERARADTRLAAIEWADNVLESARAQPWNDLTPAWAATQKLPEDLAFRMLEPVVTVTVEPEAERPLLKRVTVTVKWNQAFKAPAPPVVMSSVFAGHAG